MNDVVDRARSFLSAPSPADDRVSDEALGLIRDLVDRLDGGPILGTLKLPYPVSANDFWRSRAIVQKGTGRAMAMVYLTGEAKAWKDHAGLVAKVAGFKEPTDRTIFLRVRHHHKALLYSKHHGRKIRNGNVYDLDNVLKVSIDGLKGIVFFDDKQVKRIEASYGDESEDGGLTVEVREFEPPQATLFIDPPAAPKKDGLPF